MSVKILDLYHGNQVNSFHAIASEGYAAVILKATQGATEIDPSFSDYLARAKAAGLIVGAYTYFDPAADPILQAEHFHNNAPMGAGTLGWWLDVETLKGLRPSTSIGADARQCADKLKALTGFYPGLYASDSFYQQYLKPYFPIGDFKLWIARYRPQPPDTPCAIWQYSESGSVDGIGGAVDLDVFQGDLTTFKSTLVLP